MDIDALSAEVALASWHSSGMEALERLNVEVYPIPDGRQLQCVPETLMGSWLQVSGDDVEVAARCLPGMRIMGHVQGHDKPLAGACRRGCR